jgi:hypothetical protein
MFRIDGADVSEPRSAAWARRELGLGRTFQILDLCESLTVAANVGPGREAGVGARAGGDAAVGAAGGSGT